MLPLISGTRLCMYLFARNKCSEIKKKDLEASIAYHSLGDDNKAVWKAKRREQLEKHPYVKGIH